METAESKPTVKPTVLDLVGKKCSSCDYAEAAHPVREMTPHGCWRNFQMFESPDSSNVFGAIYWPDFSYMVIVYKSKAGIPNTAYEYENWPEANWQEFATSVSKGHFVLNCIKANKIPATRIPFNAFKPTGSGE